ncbi:MFS transporter [Actinomadura namibiensis]|uniref:MFS family permease n=1 Tax=Actinomadura namibiensis TaxID=182080 RepID=A0A7W3LW69_ACTNM|nr:MFS transporter [Actinomadura namibiensis]MBA8955352.1 MFS family permease [Actinomadura namibiensis]
MAFGADGLARYLAAAILVRGSDSGAAVGLVLLALRPDGGRGAAATGGLLAAALSAPHLLGPWLARRLDAAGDDRRLLAGAFAIYAAALTAGTLALGRAPLPVALLAVAAAGCCGPLLTGGLSSRLAAGGDRRVQGWDALTYGVGGTAGPAAVAAASASWGPVAALLGLAAATVLAAALTLTLPSRPAARPRPDAPADVRAGMAPLWRRPELRRVTVMTLLAAPQLGALPVIAAAVGDRLRGTAEAGATLTTAFGLGGLAGALLVTAVPLRGEPERAATRLFAALAAVTALCALAPSYPVALAGFALIGVANSLSFTAVLAARAAYSPPAARAQVFVTSAGLKMATASVGAAVAGAFAGIGGAALLLLAATVTGSSVALSMADRARP